MEDLSMQFVEHIAPGAFAKTIQERRVSSFRPVPFRAWIRSKTGRWHALRIDGSHLTLCGRALQGVASDGTGPDCRHCRRGIERLTVLNLVGAGYDADSVIESVKHGDLALLRRSEVNGADDPEGFAAPE